MDLLNLYFRLFCDNKDIVFAWIPEHVGIQENSVFDLAAKRALEKPVNKRLAVPYSDFKVLTNMYTRKLWQTDGKDIQRISCIRFNSNWMVPFHRIVDVSMGKPNYADYILVTHF